MTPVEAAVVGLLAGLFLGWLARATAGRRLAMPEQPTAPPKVSAPRPPPSGGDFARAFIHQNRLPRSSPPVELPPPKPPAIRVAIGGKVLPPQPWPAPPE